MVNVVQLAQLVYIYLTRWLEVQVFYYLALSGQGGLGPTAQRNLSQILAKCLSSTNKKSYVNNYNNSNKVSF